MVVPGEDFALPITHFRSLAIYRKSFTMLWVSWYTTRSMFQVTDAALKALHKGRIDAEHAEGEVMRLISEGDGFGFKLGSARLTDMVFQYEQQDVLLVASALNRTMGHMHLDAVNRNGKNSFVLEPAGS